MREDSQVKESQRKSREELEAEPFDNDRRVDRMEVIPLCGGGQMGNGTEAKGKRKAKMKLYKPSMGKSALSLFTNSEK
ncbi:hypothetical protein C1H46_040177 [Malus baccata]|uniref:Uncharacterized protein n=1 Tax=Malus baccata TaxID=106549 RepID=A0A540KJ98_MALBA|nr:hypothetical protein C1H46_040177 [Malus baccata]